jgi:hypothetical protein
MQVERLLCLQSIIHSGLNPDVLDMYWCVLHGCIIIRSRIHLYSSITHRREYSHSYGFQHVLTLDNFTKAGLLRPKVCLLLFNVCIQLEFLTSITGQSV